MMAPGGGGAGVSPQASRLVFMPINQGHARAHVMPLGAVQQIRPLQGQHAGVAVPQQGMVDWRAQQPGPLGQLNSGHNLGS